MRPDEPRAFEPGPTIDLQDSEQVDYWTERFDATPDELAKAVQAVGTHRTAVSLYLGEAAAL